MITLVYVDGLLGPTPQLWHTKLMNTKGELPKTLQVIELADTYGSLSLAQLSTLFPYTGEPTNGR